MTIKNVLPSTMPVGIRQYDTVAFEFHSDACDGWLKVPLELIKWLPGLEGEISRFSYRSTIFAFLEEDCDAEMFYNAYCKAFGHAPLSKDVYDGSTSFIRHLRGF